MFVVIQWFSCYNKIMTSDKFIYLFGRIIPALSLILSMALRFVPRFIGQLHIIRNGQKSMGRDTTNGNILQRAYHGLNMLSILVTWALENAIQTSDSMRSRGYGLRGRTAFSIYRFTKKDKIIGVIMAGLFAVIVTGCARGAVFAQYDPRILLAGFTIQGKSAPVACSTGLALATYLAFGFFCFIPVILYVAEARSLERSRRNIGQDMGVTYRRIYEEIEQEGL